MYVRIMSALIGVRSSRAVSGTANGVYSSLKSANDVPHTVFSASMVPYFSARRATITSLVQSGSGEARHIAARSIPLTNAHAGSFERKYPMRHGSFRTGSRKRAHFAAFSANSGLYTSGKSRKIARVVCGYPGPITTYGSFSRLMNAFSLQQATVLQPQRTSRRRIISAQIL